MYIVAGGKARGEYVDGSEWSLPHLAALDVGSISSSNFDELMDRWQEVPWAEVQKAMRLSWAAKRADRPTALWTKAKTPAWYAKQVKTQGVDRIDVIRYQFSEFAEALACGLLGVAARLASRAAREGGGAGGCFTGDNFGVGAGTGCRQRAGNGLTSPARRSVKP